MPDWQTIAVVLIVGCAAAFLGWKLFGHRGASIRPNAPDVPVSKLVRKRETAKRPPVDG